MSYIRSTSNPEALYVFWEAGYKIPTVSISRGSALWGGDWPKDSYVPRKNFNAILKSWKRANAYQEVFKSGELTLKEEYVSNHGRPWLRRTSISVYYWRIKLLVKSFFNSTRKAPMKEMFKFFWPQNKDFQWVMRYRNEIVFECHHVTMFYLAQHVQ